jgi:hypothetical protein
LEVGDGLLGARREQQAEQQGGGMKSEIRNPKSEGNPKAEIRKPVAPVGQSCCLPCSRSAYELLPLKKH